MFALATVVGYVDISWLQQDMDSINEEPMAIAVRDNRIHLLEVFALVLAN